MAKARAELITSYPERPRPQSLGRRIRKLWRGFRWGFALRLVKAAFHVAKAGGRPYEPVEIGGRRFDNVRETDTRWQAVAATLREYDVRNVLDVGCAEGWFVRRAATDLNCFAIGIEATDVGVVGELARLYDRAERMATVRAFMTPEAIRALPKFDAVICMSVLHHVVRAFGVPSAEQFLRALASRVDKVFIFEIGTADESSWAAFLPELGQGQDVFVRDLLERCGFHHVRVIAASPAYHREVERFLFIAEPVREANLEILKSLQSA
jgi:hypothetical protein